MNKAVQLALMAKAKKVFLENDTFLSFPVTPLAFKKEQLRFGVDDNPRNLDDFTRLVNQLPEDEAWLQTNPTYLWEVYEETLRDMNLADSSRTSAEEAEYQKARRFLGMDDVNSGGSPAFKLYRQYKDAYYFALRTYKTTEGTAIASTDPSERELWTKVTEPALRQELTTLETDWIIQGYKNDVEAAQNKVAQLGAKDPYVTLGEWRSRCNRDIDTWTNPADLVSVYPTPFNPVDALEHWQTWTLSGDEVKQLIKEAPAELQAKLADSSGEQSFESLTFETRDVPLERPWFSKEVFKARFWRFAEQNKIISSGTNPATGLCPAYVTAVIFARNILGKPTPPKSGTNQPTSTQPVVVGGLKFPVATLQPAPLKQINLAAAPKPNIRMQVMPNLAALIQPAPTKPAPAPKPSAPTAQPNLTASALKLPMNKNLVAQPVRDIPVPAKTHKFKALEFTSLPTKPKPTPGDQAKPTPPANQPPDDSIYILAFVCKIVPRCPNPDPNMQWSSE